MGYTLSKFKTYEFEVSSGACGMLAVSLTERSTVRLTGSLFVTVRLTERSTVRLTVRQSVRQGVRHDKIRLILIKYGLFWTK